MSKVVKVYKTYTTVVRFGELAVVGLMILLATVGVLPTNGGDFRFGEF